MLTLHILTLTLALTVALNLTSNANSKNDYYRFRSEI